MAEVDTDAESVRTESQGGEEHLLYLAELSSEQLQSLNQDTRDALSVLKAETDMLEKFHNRLDPKDLVPLPASDTGVSTLDFTQMRSRRRSKSRSHISDRLLSLTVDQKCELVQKELEESKGEAQRDKESTERILNGLKATMEEAEVRSTETKKSLYEFERDIGKGVVSSKKGAVVSSEKIIRYMEEKIRAKDSLVDKLRLKNASLKVQKKKMKMQLKQKEEMGEILHEADFQQLKIENAQFLERIDERNQDLLQLKLTAGETLLVLNSFKKKLHNATTESAHLDKEMLMRKEMLQRIELETQVAEQDREKAERLNKKLREQLSDYRVPDVLQYIKKNIEEEELEKSIRTWERKVDIAELSLKTHRRTWEQLKASSQMHIYDQQQRIF